MHLKGTKGKDTSWPDNAENVQIVPFVGVIQLFYQYFFLQSSYSCSTNISLCKLHSRNCSINISTTEVYVPSNQSSSGWSHIGLPFTSEEQKRVTHDHTSATHTLVLFMSPGLVHDAGPRSWHLALFIMMSGLVHGIWPCSWCLALFMMPSLVYDVWPCSWCLALFMTFGLVYDVWPHSWHLASFMMPTLFHDIWPC